MVDRSDQVDFGQIFMRSNSILTGSSFWVNPRRRVRRFTWVSTVMPGVLNAWPRTTLAVFRPTPGSFIRSSRVSGTLSWCSLWMISPVFWMFLALLLKKLIDFRVFLSASIGASARDFGVG